MITASVTNFNSKDDDEVFLSAPPTMDEEAYYGILKRFISIAEVNSEASPVAVSANVIAFFCAMIGRSACQWIGDSKIHCRPFFLLSGKSGRSRKGTAEGLARRVFKRVDELYAEKYPGHQDLNIHSGGLSSGEGICYAIRDLSGNDSGVADKRLLVIEPEFANVLSNARRETSTLSPIIRNVFDGRTIAPLTKNNQTCATDPHVVIIGHITCDELKKMTLKSGEATNGFLNRFLICHVTREKLVPLPDVTPSGDIDLLANAIIEILEFILQEITRSGGEIEVSMNQEAKIYWSEVYADISQDHPGIIGSLLARSEVYCRMLAMIFAIFDKKILIEVGHIKAALCWISYVKKSAWNIFGNANEQSEETEIGALAKKIFKFLQNKTMSSTEISKALNGHKSSKQIKEALEYLLNQSPAKITQSKEETDGRSKVIYAVK